MPTSKRSRWLLAAGALLVLSVVLLVVAISGLLRRHGPVVVSPDQASSTVKLVARRLDGVFVPEGEADKAPIAIMVENHTAARPLSGISKASVVIEAPVEGGITRFLCLFDATTTVAEVGPVRSARPYYVDWARSWNASYFHVGGSPEALDKIRALGASFNNVDEMGSDKFFWRSEDRYAPHNTYTKQELTLEAITARGFENQKTPIAWHFQDVVTTTQRGSVLTIRIPFGGSYNVTWKYDKETNTYQRYQTTQAQFDKDGTPVQAENIIVIKTDGQVLDNVGRLRVRTTGSGDAFAYRDGNKYPLVWRRSAGEVIKFENVDGAEYLLNRGRTWIEVTTDDRIFAGLDATK